MINIVDFFVEETEGYQSILSNPDIHVWMKSVFYQTYEKI